MKKLGNRYICNGQQVTRDEFLALYEQYKAQCKQDKYDREEREHRLYFRDEAKAYERIQRWLDEGHKVTAECAYETFYGASWFSELQKHLDGDFNYKITEYDRWYDFPCVIEITNK